jgi:hypothetical protein
MIETLVSYIKANENMDSKYNGRGCKIVEILSYHMNYLKANSGSTPSGLSYDPTVAIPNLVKVCENRNLNGLPSVWQKSEGSWCPGFRNWFKEVKK